MVSIAAVVLLSFSSLTLAAVDLTRTDDAKGRSVVESVVNLIGKSCIFNDDNLFVRRLAYVESHDGVDANTYRPGYDGGIWQVTWNLYLRL